MRRLLAVGTLLATIFGAILASPLFVAWWNRPIIVVDIQEYELPSVYFETISKETLSDIPRVNIIRITNKGRSKGIMLSLFLKTNNNTTLQGVDVEGGNEFTRYETKELESGASRIELHMDYIRPHEGVTIKALTNVRANLGIETGLIDSGEIVSRNDLEQKKNNRDRLFAVMAGILGVIAGIVTVLYGSYDIRWRKSKK